MLDKYLLGEAFFLLNIGQTVMVVDGKWIIISFAYDQRVVDKNNSAYNF